MNRLLAVLFCLLLPLSAAAQTISDGRKDKEPAAPSGPPMLMLKQYEASHPEKAVMVFYKLSGQEPDFLEWAKKSPFLKNAKEMDRDTIVSREDNRLRRAYSEFSAGDPLVVHTKILFDEYSTLREILHLSEFTPKTYFAFSLYGENIAIVPKDIAKFGDMPMTKHQMDEMLQKAGGGEVLAELLLKPVVADAKEPFVAGDKSYWLVLAEILEMRFWSKDPNDPQLLWVYRAEGYKPKDDQGLMDLKGGQGN